MDFEVVPFRDSHGRWHRHILGAASDRSGSPAIWECCHEEASSADCIGFADWGSAIESGWQMVRKFLGQNSQLHWDPTDSMRISKKG